MTLFPYVRTPVLLADFVRRAYRRGTSERSLGEGRYWRVEESLRNRHFLSRLFFQISNFSLGTSTRFTPDFRLVSPAFLPPRRQLTTPCVPSPQPPQSSWSNCLWVQQLLVSCSPTFGALTRGLSVFCFLCSNNLESTEESRADTRRCLETALRIHTIRIPPQTHARRGNVRPRLRPQIRRR